MTGFESIRNSRPLPRQHAPGPHWRPLRPVAPMGTAARDVRSNDAAHCAAGASTDDGGQLFS